MAKGTRGGTSRAAMERKQRTATNRLRGVIENNPYRNNFEYDGGGEFSVSARSVSDSRAGYDGYSTTRYRVMANGYTGKTEVVTSVDRGSAYTRGNRRGSRATTKEFDTPQSAMDFVTRQLKRNKVQVNENRTNWNI